jgi:hypothetical protein
MRSVGYSWPISLSYASRSSAAHSHVNYKALLETMQHDKQPDAKTTEILTIFVPENRL